MENESTSAHDLTIIELADIQAGQPVNIKARFYKSTIPVKEVDVNGVPRRCQQNNVLVDDTGKFHFTQM